MRRAVWWIAPVVALAGFASIVLNPLGLLPNVGLRFGYYGSHNRVLAIVEEWPGVVVWAESCHEDVTMEDSFITVQHQGRFISLEFAWERLGMGYVDVDALLASYPERLTQEIETVNGNLVIDVISDAMTRGAD